ncbi:MAG: polysaccharide biosynthesis/export family protein [Endomicrobiales bacterium]
MINHNTITSFILACSIPFMCPLGVCSEDNNGTGGVPTEVAAAGGAMNGEYKINPSELLEISVYQKPDLNRTVRVSADGSISFPLIGKVQVGGCSVIESEEKIARMLGSEYLINPQVTVFVKEYHNKKVFILGEVNAPGSYDIPNDRELTIIEAITLAGGFTKLAAINKTKILRMENGKQRYIEVRVSDITQKGDKSKDITLNPADIIFVPERIF